MFMTAIITVNTSRTIITATLASSISSVTRKMTTTITFTFSNNNGQTRGGLRESGRG